METFGYLSVLLSVIIGLALTQLLQGIRGIALHRRRVRLYWPVLAWATTLLLVYVQSWWAMFGLRTHERWTFLQFCAVIAHTVLLYMLSALLLPDIGSHDERTDLRDHYFTHRRLFHAVLFAVALVSIGKDLALAGTLPEPANLAFHVLFLGLTFAGIATPNERYHSLVAVVALVAFVLYALLLFSSLETDRRANTKATSQQFSDITPSAQLQFRSLHPSASQRDRELLAG